MGVLSIGLFFSCAKEIDYYRVTIKTTDGIILYDDEKPGLSVTINRPILGNISVIQIYNVGYYDGFLNDTREILFEITGNNLLVTRVFTKRETR